MEILKYPYFQNTERIFKLADGVCPDAKYRLTEIIEYHNLLKFLKDKDFSNIYSGKNVNEYIAKINKLLSTYFHNKTKNEIIADLKFMFDANNSEGLQGNEKIIILNYQEDYLECFEKYNLSKKIDEKNLEETIQSLNIPAMILLRENYFNHKYPELMKKVFLSDARNIELLFDNYTDDYGKNKKKYYIPKNITKIEMYQLCQQYIENDITNSNYLKLIEQGIHDLTEMNIDGKLKLRAKEKIDKFEKAHFFNEDGTFINNGFSQKIVVHTRKEDYETEKSDMKVLIDIDWLKENHEPETLLNYLMHSEYFFTKNWILNLCSFPNFESSIFEKVFGIKTKKHYEASYYFLLKSKTIQLCFQAFETFLKSELDTRIEDLIHFFFTEYSEVNHQIKWLGLDFTKVDEKISIQVKNLFTVEENIRKQWKLFVMENEIDRNLFEFENTPKIKDLKSLTDKKYIYTNTNNNEINRILQLLFSDQAGISYVDENLHEDIFIDLILKHSVNINMLNNYQKQSVDFLNNNNIISIDVNGFVYLDTRQHNRIMILLCLYTFGVIHYYHNIEGINTIKAQKIEIDKMIAEGILTFENTLFSKPETDFLNYILNNSEFDNALALRNKYLHGSVTDDKYEDYLYTLIVLIVYVIKINDDLVLAEKSGFSCNIS